MTTTEYLQREIRRAASGGQSASRILRPRNCTACTRSWSTCKRR